MNFCRLNFFLIKEYFLVLSTAFFLIAAIIPLASFSQASSNSDDKRLIFIPQDKFEFSPPRSEVVNIASQEITLTLSDYPKIFDGAICKFSVKLIGKNEDPASQSFSSQVLNNRGEDKYNGSCSTTLPPQGRDIYKAYFEIRIQNPDGDFFGADIQYIDNLQIAEELIDFDNYELPKNLYIKPRIDILSSKRQPNLGETTEFQFAFSNDNDYPIRDYNVKASIDEQKIKIDCSSIYETNQPIQEETLSNKFFDIFSVKTLAQTGNLIVNDCKDYEMDLTFREVAKKKPARVNFKGLTEKEGLVEINFATNLDQGSLGGNTKKSITIVPKAPIEEPLANDNRWIYFLILIASLIVVFVVVSQGYNWYTIRKLKNKKNLEINN